MKQKRQLDVLISTFGYDGIKRVAQMGLPQTDGVTFVVSWQTNGADRELIPECLRRDDIEIYPSKTVGISINRNLAISYAKAPICLTADDDLIYTSDQLNRVIKIFELNPDVDVASFMFEGPDPKSYPSQEIDLTNKFPKNFWSSAIEIAFQRARLTGKVQYDENFGPGQHELQAGEDTVFLYDCIRKGLNCRFFPIIITTHPHLSTGHRPITNKGVIMADGAYIRKVYGIKGLPRLPLCVWRNYKKGRVGFWWGLWHIFRGYFYKLKY